ncbi:Major facilitator superfamily MFS-1 domain containing protein [Aphelenchoides bicaudatus]|nr:Major facilitator superfamily MFS-1 domain containing protein [Aphelenchoides bicaudatus]
MFISRKFEESRADVWSTGSLNWHLIICYMADNDGDFASTKLWSKQETKLMTINYFIGTMCLYSSRVALPISNSVLSQTYGWNKSDAGTIMSCFFWGYTITQIFAGKLADKYSGERILNITTLAWALLTLFTPQLFDLAYWSGYPMFFLLLLRILTGIGQGFHSPSLASIVSKHLTATDKGRVFGICLAGSHFGSVVAGSLGSIILEAFGWRSLFYFVGKHFKCYLVVHLSLLDRKVNNTYGNRIAPADSKTTLNKAKGSEASLLPLDKKKHTNDVDVPWKQLFSHPAFWAASVAQYAGANAYFTIFSWLPSYFSDHFPNSKGAIYNTVPYLAIVLSALVSPFIAARLISHGRSVTFTRKFMEGTSLVLAALCLLAVSASSTFYAALLLFSLAMLARGLHHGGVSVNPLDFAPNHTGSVFGIFNAFSAITGLVGVYVAGMILHSTNDNWSLVWFSTSVQCVLGAIVYSMFGTGEKII